MGNPERDKKKQDKIKNKENDKENQESFTTKELANNKKDKKVINSKIIVEKNDSLNKIPTTEKSLKLVGESPERDKKTIRKQDTIRDKITKEFLPDKNSVNQKFEWTNLKMIKNFHNTILERDSKKDKTLNHNTKIYIRKKRYIMAFYVPKSTIYIHSNTKRILEIKNLYHQDNEIIKFRNLKIWKLLDIKSIYHNKNEIIKFGGEAIKYKKSNINETKIQKDWKIKRLLQENRNRCEAKKLIVLNYTERGKRQKIYYYIFLKFLFYTLYIFYILLTHTHTHKHTQTACI